MDEFSLLWRMNTVEDKKASALLDHTIKDLDLDYLCKCMAKDSAEEKAIREVMVQMTEDVDTITYRSDIFTELMEDPELRKELADLVGQLQVLGEFKNVRLSGSDTSSIWELISRLKELYSYIDCIDLFYRCLGKRTFQSEGLNQLKQHVTKIYEGSGFQYLKEDIERLTADISRIKSLTLGVNLDKNLNPCEVQLISLNQEEFKSEDNAILKAFITCFAGSMANSLLKSNHDVDPLMKALTRRVEEMLAVVVKDMRVSLHKYVDVSGYGITRLIPELIFYIRAAAICDQLIERGLPLCKAECIRADASQLQVKAFYNLRLAVHEQSTAETMTLNDFTFDATHKQYILTGPNRGGKTIFTQGIGLLYLLAQAGVYVPAKEMKFTPVDQIYTHFPADENQTVALGRLGEEAERLRSIVEQVTDHSLVLLNESLSSTSYSEGLFIARDVVKAFQYAKVNLIYNTHMHELAADLACMHKTQGEEAPAEASTINSIVSLVMGIDGDKRNYTARIAPPTGNSYARDIAKKYGILYDQMKELIKNKSVVSH